MKVITYTLDADGTIPSWVIDGGYFPKLNQKASPQDFDLVGIVGDTVDGEGFDLDSLIEYVQSFIPVFINPNNNQTKTAANVVTAWWQQNVGV